MRTLTFAQHRALDAINARFVVVGWCNEQHGPIVRNTDGRVKRDQGNMVIGADGKLYETR